MKILFTLLCFIGLLAFMDGNALSFYCKDRLVSEEDTMIEVYQKCGEPDFKEQHVEKERDVLDLGVKRTVYIVVDEWTYNFGPLDWLYRIRFENGRLKKIETMGYGFLKK